jgi:hypothetical protein
MLRRVIFIATSMLAVASPAFAELQISHLKFIHGKVLVQQGQGFFSANLGADLRPGDKILVSENGSAIVAYPNGCEVTVSGRSMLTVAPKAPCPAGGKVARLGAEFAAPVAYTGGGMGLPPPVIGLGAFATVLGTALIVNWTKPVSAPAN